MRNGFAICVSYVFHPLFLFFFLILFVYVSNPFSFNMPGQREFGVFLIMTFTILVLFPAISVLLMRNLSLIRSLKMEDKTERIGPLIAAMIFYIWYFINVKDNASFPILLSAVSLGGTIAVVFGFFLNNFSKISLHTIGAGAFLSGIFIICFYDKIPELVLELPFLGRYSVSIIFVLFLALVVAGLVGYARLVLEAHQERDIYRGYLVGVSAQLLGFLIVI